MKFPSAKAYLLARKLILDPASDEQVKANLEKLHSHQFWFDCYAGVDPFRTFDDEDVQAAVGVQGFKLQKAAMKNAAHNL